MRPNLFSFATRELSQDAMLCWLLAWAHAPREQVDPALHRLGVHVVRRLIDLHPTALQHPLADNFEVEVRRQLLKIDVVAFVGDQLMLVIEDKVGTKNHSDQLRRYRVAAEQKWKDRQVLYFYVQTGDQCDYEPVRRQGFAVVTRPMLLEILREGATLGIRDAIFRDFLAHLETIEAAVQSWQHIPPNSWSRNAWRGFYMALRAELGQGGWNYVPNPAGGFMGFWWNVKEHPETTIYLQLKQAALEVKINVPDKAQRRTLRGRWSRRVIEAGQQAGMNWRKPKRFGNGRYMTIAQLPGGYRVVSQSGLLDMPHTVERLREATTFLDRMMSPASSFEPRPTPSAEVTGV